MMHEQTDSWLADFGCVKRSEALPEEDHAHAGDGGWWGAAQIVGLKQEVDVGAELNPLTAGHREQAIIIQHRV